MPGDGLLKRWTSSNFTFPSVTSMLVSLCYIYCVQRPNWSQELPPWMTLTAALIKLKRQPTQWNLCWRMLETRTMSTWEINSMNKCRLFFFLFFAWHLLNWAALILLFMQSLPHGPLSSRRSEGKKRCLLTDWVGSGDGFSDWQGLLYLKQSVNTSLKSSCWSFLFFFFFLVNWCTVFSNTRFGWCHQSHWMCSQFVPAVCLFAKLHVWILRLCFLCRSVGLSRVLIIPVEVQWKRAPPPLILPFLTHSKLEGTQRAHTSATRLSKTFLNTKGGKVTIHCFFFLDI